MVTDSSEDFWLEKWRTAPEGKPGWRGEESDKSFLAILPTLKERIPKTLPLHALLPLCGNTPVLKALHEIGFEVVGVEFVKEAIDSFFTTYLPEAEPSLTAEEKVNLYQIDGLTLRQQDFFTLESNQEYSLIYDRAALIAISPDRRQEYSTLLSSSLLPGGFLYLETVSAPGCEATHAPFPVRIEELERIFSSLRLESQESVEVYGEVEAFTSRGADKVLKTTSIFRAN